MTKAVFPGSFDPFTNGHLAIVQRASRMFDQVVIVVGVNTKKTGWLPVELRVQGIEQSVSDFTNVAVTTTTGLIGDLMERIQAQVLVRGVRNAFDFDAEKGLASFNHQLFPDVDTVLLPTEAAYEALSSSRVRELFAFGADFTPFVPDSVSRILIQKRDQNAK